MNPIQTDVSAEALVTAIRANMCDFFRHTSRSNPVEHFENEQFTRWHTPLPHPWFNGVLSSKLPETDASFIPETINYFRNKGVNTFTWWLEPHLKPGDWDTVLYHHGFGFSNETPGMAVDLQELNDVTPSPDRFEVREVTDEASMRTWATVFVQGYGLPPAWESITVDVWMQLGLDFPFRNYLGYWNGQPVCTATLFYGGGAAGIYCVATLPAARGKGYGAAVTLEPLRDARERGYRIGVLQSSAMGFNVYKRLGFKHLCQIEYFYLSLK
jgi:ribosomal protein S18 acetylase RimI-like enzyme